MITSLASTWIGSTVSTIGFLKITCEAASRQITPKEDANWDTDVKLKKLA
jgi:hypothetical protein